MALSKTHISCSVFWCVFTILIGIVLYFPKEWVPSLYIHSTNLPYVLENPMVVIIKNELIDTKSADDIWIKFGYHTTHINIRNNHSKLWDVLNNIKTTINTVDTSFDSLVLMYYGKIKSEQFIVIENKEIEIDSIQKYFLEISKDMFHLFFIQNLEMSDESQKCKVKISQKHIHEKSLTITYNNDQFIKYFHSHMTTYWTVLQSNFMDTMSKCGWMSAHLYLHSLNEYYLTYIFGLISEYECQQKIYWKENNPFIYTFFGLNSNAKVARNTSLCSNIETYQPQLYKMYYIDEHEKMRKQNVATIVDAVIKAALGSTFLTCILVFAMYCLL
eukprot:90360_1